jgi:hypothetical protein
MRITSIGAALLIALLGVEGACAAGSPAFCRTWLKVCNQTCPGGPGTCGGVCDARYQTCLSSGCFPFNVPGPRCQDNTRDQTATAKAKKTLNQGGRVGCGPRFGGRPCD